MHARTFFSSKEYFANQIKQLIKDRGGRKGGAKRLAYELKVDPVTVRRWAAGVVEPERLTGKQRENLIHALHLIEEPPQDGSAQTVHLETNQSIEGPKEVSSPPETMPKMLECSAILYAKRVLDTRLKQLMKDMTQEEKAAVDQLWIKLAQGP